VLVRLTDSARDRFFDKNGDPKEIRVIKNETSGCIKVGDDVFEFDILKETGRCEIVEFEYVSLRNDTHTHTHTHTTATPRKQWFVWQTYHIGSSLNKI
jgi:hypothetical protein